MHTTRRWATPTRAAEALFARRIDCILPFLLLFCVVLFWGRRGGTKASLATNGWDCLIVCIVVFAWR